MGSTIDVKGGMDWSALPSGNVQLRIGDEDQKFVEVEVPPRMMSLVVADALLATGAASESGGQGGGQGEDELEELPAVPISKIALAAGALDGHKTLVLEIGAAQLGFTVPDAALVEFGKLLLQLDPGANPSG